MWPHVATLNIVPGTGPYQFRWIRISPGCWILVADSSPGRVEEAAGKGFACWPEAVGFVPGNNHDSQGLLWTNFLCQVFTMYQLENSHGTHFMEVRNMTFPWQMVDFKVTLSIYIDIYIYISICSGFCACVGAVFAGGPFSWSVSRRTWTLFRPVLNGFMACQPWCAWVEQQGPVPFGYSVDFQYIWIRIL